MTSYFNDYTICDHNCVYVSDNHKVNIYCCAISSTYVIYLTTIICDSKLIRLIKFLHFSDCIVMYFNNVDEYIYCSISHYIFSMTYTLYALIYYKYSDIMYMYSYGER